MKKLNHLLLAALALLAFSCVDSQEEDFLLDAGTKTIPAGSREVKINLDPKYDLVNTVAYGLYDTMAMNVKNRSLAVPHGASDVVMFVDKNTDKVLAVVGVRANETQLNVNAETVTAALHDLIPAYATLSVEGRQSFSESATSSPAYRSLVSTVDRLLSSKAGIYSTDNGLVDNIRALNRMISESFADQTADANQRVVQDMKYWTSSGETARINNRSFAYVDAQFTPNRIDSNRESYNFVLNPRPLSRNQYSITDTDVPDGYYSLTITQRSAAARQANQMALSNNLLFLTVGESFFNLQTQGAEACANTMVTALYAELDKFLENETNNMDAAFLQALSISATLTQKLLNDPTCTGFVNNNQALIASIIQRTMLLAVILDGNTFIRESAGFAFYMEALFMPFEFKEYLMVQQGRVVPGQLRFEMVEDSYDKDYPRRASLNPEVRAVVLSQYDDIDFTMFSVYWETRYANNGTVSNDRTYFNSEGIATTRWTLPDRRTDNYLNAFVRNEDGRDLMGSPMCFVVSTRRL